MSNSGLPQAELGPGRFPTRRITTKEALHKQNYEQGAYKLHTSRITSRELASCLAGWLGGLRSGNLSCAWLAGWLAGWGAGWLAEAQRGPERPREAQRGGAWIERACHALGGRRRPGAFWKPFSGLGPFKKRLPNTYIRELIKLATGATRGPLETFFQELGPFKRAASQCVSCY